MDKSTGWESLKLLLENHLHAMMDAPFRGWKREFIDGYEEAILRVKKDMERIENDPNYRFHSGKDFESALKRIQTLADRQNTDNEFLTYETATAALEGRNPNYEDLSDCVPEDE